MTTYVALTTTNFQLNGYHEIARGSDKATVKQQAQASIGTPSPNDIYTQTKQRNLIVMTLSEAKRKGYARR